MYTIHWPVIFLVDIILLFLKHKGFVVTRRSLGWNPFLWVEGEGMKILQTTLYNVCCIFQAIQWFSTKLLFSVILSHMVGKE